MSKSDSMSNPFLALFQSPDEAEKFREQFAESYESLKKIKREVIDCTDYKDTGPGHGSVEQEKDSKDIKESESEQHFISHTLEEIFRFTLSEVPCCSEGGPVSLVYLREVHEALDGKPFLDLDCIDQALFDRLLTEDADQNLVHRKNYEDAIDLEKAVEGRVIFYLYQCFHRLSLLKKLKNEISTNIRKVIVFQTATALCYPELFPESSLHEDLIQLLLSYHDETGHADSLSHFLVEVALSITTNTDLKLVDVLKQPFQILQEKLRSLTVIDRNLFVLLDIFHYFTKSSILSKALLEYSMPQDQGNGKSFQNSLLGLPLSISCLPKAEHDSFEFFQEPSKYSPQEHNAMQERLWLPLGAITKQMYKLFYTMLRQGPEIKHLLLKWLGTCLEANSGRAKLWNSQVPEDPLSTHASDGFCINLETVLLLLCKPFAEPLSPKLLNIDPTYCAAECETGGEAASNIHLTSLPKETCLIPRNDDDVVEKKNYNFTTECFFATQRALKLGFGVVNERLVKINQDLTRIQRLYEEARIQGGESSEVVVRLKENMERGVTKFLSYRTALLLPDTLDLMLNFHIATASWLVNTAISDNINKFAPVQFPLPKNVSKNLGYIPEFVLENIADCSIFIKRFSPKTFEMCGDTLDHLMTLILVLMGSPDRVKNPHLRAHLAEMLEALMPSHEGEQNTVLLPSIYREKLFMSHPFGQELVPTVLHVFVSIEMTGQSVAFEQKFQYRRPMYIVLDYLWNIEQHKQKMKELAEEAERDIESPHPPLFLHFINLLINDAIFLLDEALSYMSKLREIQLARDNGTWSSLPHDQRFQQEANLHHLGLLAKFHNVMSNETIRTLQWLTTEIKSIFCHPTIVERITAMLNYFLLHLVGPQKKNLKVKDLKEYEFKPQALVQDICKIYKNLGSSNEPIAEAFCLAVSRDGRSYSPDLFPQAEAVLNKIGQVMLGTELEEIAIKVKSLACRQQQEEELLSEAPEEFLDPIMSTIMKDPVKLPSSGVIVDRPTIARHLLSDQTDPFNRSPLTMDMVEPDYELKAKIDKWRQDRMNEL